LPCQAAQAQLPNIHITASSPIACAMALGDAGGSEELTFRLAVEALRPRTSRRRGRHKECGATAIATRP